MKKIRGVLYFASPIKRATYERNISFAGRNKKENAELKSENDEGYLAIDVIETEDNIFILAPIAGVEEQDVSLSLSDDLLVISGNRVRPEFLQKKAEDSFQSVIGVHFLDIFYFLPQ